MKLVPAEINRTAPGGVLLVGRDPGEQEVAYSTPQFPDGRPFVGPSGYELERVLAETGLRRVDVNITNVVGVRPSDNKFELHDPTVVEAGVQSLHQLVRRLRPKLTIALGNEASYALLGASVWPSRGKGIFGAKGIGERRGYFWPNSLVPGGWVLTTLHPSGVLHKQVPGSYLLEVDFRRARKWLAGKLPREAPPEAKRLDVFALKRLLGSTLVAWDIETKWGGTSISMSGFCGDDLQPYIGLYPREKSNIFTLLTSGVSLVGHNGDGFDLPVMELNYGVKVKGYRHDTQHMWWALEPELAGKEEQSEEGGTHGSKMTRKALGTLMAIYDFNVGWWKDYPTEDDHEDVKIEKQWAINTVDTWGTRILASSMLPEIKKADVTAQYVRSMELVPWSVRQHLRGMKVDEPLRLARIQTLSTRGAALREKSSQVALGYVREHQVEYFRDVTQCECCNGGKLSAKACWRCAGLPQKPEQKLDYLPLLLKQIDAPRGSEEAGAAFKKAKVSALKALMPPCATCQGTGKLVDYHFNPMSVQQMHYLLYTCLGVPKTYMKGKVMTDEAALRKVLRWCKSGVGELALADGALGAPLG